uniref:Methyltransferase type 11 domain-containing protein n=1 Tax=Chromera velia CCMP2878 TaxID=1169474 RepID=A0A0G4ID80_9ALVE|eukprot:Cvel_13312.t1-p1 / transcript=Cvel_13312.t1 / gene=Cvel_13312 / organism=Chromera_velia_CCMP2878 / gene_product=Ubiquinone/menaquinone biosynthesis, putative / transcript_product=Ubiquinone/menaquinone biosynthesis, putative / location=Cvel_scaffold903:46565-48115(-) / protein_length=517 / sequence_SO=supercontig / SO=protein_coding / is_pseudo=false
MSNWRPILYIVTGGQVVWYLNYRLCQARQKSFYEPETDEFPPEATRFNFYARMADMWDWFADKEEKWRKLDERRRDIFRLAQGHVLEVHVGSGRNLSALTESRRVRSLTCLDIVSPMLAQLRRKLVRKEVETAFPVLAVQADSIKLPYPDNTFDTVMGSHVIATAHHPHQTLREMWRVLKPDGRLLLMDFGLPENLLGQLFNEAVGNANYPRTTWDKGYFDNRRPVEEVRAAGFSVSDFKIHWGCVWAIVGRKLTKGGKKKRSLKKEEGGHEVKLAGEGEGGQVSSVEASVGEGITSEAEKGSESQSLPLHLRSHGVLETGRIKQNRGELPFHYNLPPSPPLEIQLAAEPLPSTKETLTFESLPSAPTDIWGTKMTKKTDQRAKTLLQDITYDYRKEWTDRAKGPMSAEVHRRLHRLLQRSGAKDIPLPCHLGSLFFVHIPPRDPHMHTHMTDGTSQEEEDDLEDDDFVILERLRPVTSRLQEKAMQEAFINGRALQSSPFYENPTTGDGKQQEMPK